jgi:hypothetical protein
MTTQTRPEYGFSAWQLVLGYINAKYSPDAHLKLEASPQEGRVQWGGMVSWGVTKENVAGQASVSDVLRVLWGRVEQYRHQFDLSEVDHCLPVGYEESEWLDLQTQDVLHRLLWLIDSAFKGQAWCLVLVYHPAEKPQYRVKTRLLLPRESFIGGRGANFVEALRDCFRNAIPTLSERVADDADDDFLSNV